MGLSHCNRRTLQMILNGKHKGNGNFVLLACSRRHARAMCTTTIVCTQVADVVCLAAIHNFQLPATPSSRGRERRSSSLGRRLSLREDSRGNHEKYSLRRTCLRRISQRRRRTPSVESHKRKICMYSENKEYACTYTRANENSQEADEGEVSGVK